MKQNETREGSVTSFGRCGVPRSCATVPRTTTAGHVQVEAQAVGLGREQEDQEVGSNQRSA